MKHSHHYSFKTMRLGSVAPDVVAVQRFGCDCSGEGGVDAVFLDAGQQHVIAWSGLNPIRPLVRVAMSVPEVRLFVSDALGAGSDGLFRDGEASLKFYRAVDGEIAEIAVPPFLQSKLREIRKASDEWVGCLTDDGDYVFDPRTPPPGTHFRANLLIGDRAGFPNPLLTTPKALIDEWGRGSSRSHADKQILATRWDVVPEENGFPANRQFYIVESARQIFYSAAPDKSVTVQTRHAVNRSVISYHTPDGLDIQRTFFMVPAEDGLPLGVEAQIVSVKNTGSKTRQLDLVMTGMFGYIHPGALTVDVIYTCVTVEPGVLKSASAQSPMVVAPRYTAGWGPDDRPFNITQVVDAAGNRNNPSGFCLDYRRFVGTGSLEKPENVANPDNVFPKKGPAFFALTLPVVVKPGEGAEIQSFNGLISRHEGEPVTDEVFCRRIESMADKVRDPEWARTALSSVVRFQDSYRRAVQIKSPNADVNRLFNTHLPFQIRYQTYVSRSFAMTQKGFRQIGFREIQDLFAALPFELAAGRKEHLIDLLGAWVGHVHRDGYADHQFYWNGMEPGRYSDDALWLFQAVGRFIDLTGDASILDREWPIAGENTKRSLYETLKSILDYSGRVSIGLNGLPLIDRADWNDTLNLDGEGIHGPEKMKIYRQQVAEGVVEEGQPFKSDLSESVMNGFLLEIARACMLRFAHMKKDAAGEREWGEFGDVLVERLRRSWKTDFFARASINRPNEMGVTYLGAAGDRLSGDPKNPGSYFLNSFSWSVLSGVATDEQISTMLDRIESVLVTPVGIRLSSPCRFDLLMGRSGSGDYAYGDRENGGVFKHAAMMGSVALIEAARKVADPRLAERLLSRAWTTLQVTAPFVAFKNPYVLAGNPRFCTQYTNPATGEHIGPLLSGTAPWMWLAYLSMMGISFKEGRVSVDPVLPPEWNGATLDLDVPAGRYHIEVTKPTGFARSRDRKPEILFEGRSSGPELPLSGSHQGAKVEVLFR